MNIKDILMCPECKSGLTENLKCGGCHAKYSFNRYGIYDVISEKLSSDFNYIRQTGFNPNLTDEEINKMKPHEPLYGIAEHPASKSDEYKQALQQHNEYLSRVISSFSDSAVCDLATGLGCNLQILLDAKIKDFNIICADINKRELAHTHKYKNTDDSRVFYIATDARWMSVKDASFDYIFTNWLGGIYGDCTYAKELTTELYRVLKPQGRIIIDNRLSTSNTEVTAEEMIDWAYIKSLRNAGFNITSTITAKAKNIQVFSVIQAEKC